VTEQPGPHPGVDLIEVERIERALDELPDEYREGIAKSCLAGLPHSEVAADMGRSEVAVRKLLSRPRARLAVLLERGVTPA
jgi:DNA-directed RNA polymerase specialized sigma24 family protein